MAEQKVKLTELPAATDTVDSAQLLINQNETDQKLPITHLLRSNKNLADLANNEQARANLNVPSVDDVNDQLSGYINGSRTFLAGATLSTRKDFIWDDDSKSWYYWGGDLPKDVPAASDPESTGGVATGAWAGVGDSSLRSTLASSIGAAMIGMAYGGTVQDAIISVYIDSFGADPTGSTDSTAAYNAAIAPILTLTTSAMENQLVPGCVKVVFGVGRYKLTNATIYSGFVYEGQGGFATALMPGADGAWVFRTIGTEAYETGREAKRCFRPVFRNFTVGFGFQRQFDDIPKAVNGRGIYLSDLSYTTFEDVHFRHLDGKGLELASAWDSEFYNLRFMDVGNNRDPLNPEWALAIGPGTAVEDGSNALRFYGTHIEGCPAMLYMGKRSRHIFFIGGKFESIRYANDTDYQSCIMRGCNGVSFSDLEMSWSNITKPMWDIVGSTPATDGFDTDHSCGVVFDNPSIIDSASLSGDYFKYSSGRGALLINGGTARQTRYILANCNNVVWRNTTLTSCGPTLSTTTGNVAIYGIKVNSNRVVDGANIFTLTGANNTVKDVFVESSGGTGSNNGTWFLTNNSSELIIKDVTFHGSMQYGIRGLSTKYRRLATGLNVLSDAVVTTLVDGGYASMSLPIESRGGSPWGVTSQGISVANDGATTFGGIVSACCILKVTGRGTVNHSCIVLMDSGITASTKIADLSGKFVLGGAGVPGDTNIYISRSGSDITITNRSGSTLTMYVETANAL